MWWYQNDAILSTGLSSVNQDITNDALTHVLGPKRERQVQGIGKGVSLTTTITCTIEIHHMHNELEKINKMLKEEMEVNIVTIQEEYEKKMHDVILWVSRLEVCNFFMISYLKCLYITPLNCNDSLNIIP